MNTPNNTGSIMLLECTLGSGGALLENRYGESEIRNMQKNLQKSRIDIVEYGLLCSYTAGLNSSIYNTTEFPSNFRRQGQQLYSLMLDKDSRPLLTQIPQRSEKTADIIRMSFSSERVQEDIDYYTALKEKGYLIAIVVSEVTQYDEDELALLLRRYNALKPWACYIFDESGILTSKSLGSILAVFAREFSADVRIGFQGRDNLQILSDLAETFLNYQMEHCRCLDVSLGGISPGSLQLPTEEAAVWMNEDYGTDYSIPELAYCATFTGKYIGPKEGTGAKLLYYSTAKAACSYQYVEYFSSIPVNVSEQLDIYQEVAKDAAYEFCKKDANRAILASRKKQLNLGIFVYTQDQPARILDLLSSSVVDLLKYGVEIVICDGSKDGRTHAIVSNFQVEGYCNLLYKAVPHSEDAGFEETIFASSDDYLKYSYVWLMRDEIIPTVDGFYYSLLALAEKNTAWVAVDAAFQNNGQKCSRTYRNCLDFFSDNSARLPVLGASIFNSEFLVKALAQHHRTDAQFAVIDASLRELAEQNARTALIIGNTYYYRAECLPKNMVGLDSFEVWGENWYQTVYGLPEVYRSAKPSAVRFQIAGYYPFRMKSLLRLRANNKFNLAFYRKNRVRLGEVSDTATWKYYVAAITPKLVAKKFSKAINDSVAKPGTRSARTVGLIQKVYRKFGRI